MLQLIKRIDFGKLLKSQAEIEGHGVLLQMDGNLHAGSALVKGDPNP